MIAAEPGTTTARPLRPRCGAVVMKQRGGVIKKEPSRGRRLLLEQLINQLSFDTLRKASFASPAAL